MLRTVLSLPLLILLVNAACRPAPPPEPVAEPRSAEPVTGMVPAADGVRIVYSMAGSGSPTLVFLHGWSCDRGYWTEQLAAFAADYRVVTVDLPGHGESGAERTEWSLAGLGDDVRALVEGLDLRQVILVGHSMGGPVALQAAARLPERVIGVIGVDTLHDAAWQFDSAEWQGLTERYRQDFAGTCDAFVRSMFLADAAVELVDRVAQDMCAAPPQVALALFEDFPNFQAAAALEAVQVPVRVINAASYPTNVEGNRVHAPSFDAVIMDGVGHFPMLERPQEFNSRLAELIAPIAAAAPDAGASRP